MKKNTFFMAAILVTLSAHSQTKWGFDASHAKVGFSISHFGISETEGKFTKYEGTVLSDKPDFSDAKVDFKIDVSSINTEEPKRDEHLRSADFFDVAKFPNIIFTSKKITPAGKNLYKLTGNLTMHGITREVTLNALYKGTVPSDPYGNTKAGFKVTGNLDRTKWGLTWNGTLAVGELLVGNNVTLDINFELIKLK